MWYLQVDQHEEGPLTEAELIVLAQTGEIGPDSLIRETEGDWVAAEEIEMLADAFEAPLDMRRDHGPPLLIFGWISVGICLLELARAVFAAEPRNAVIDDVLAEPTGTHLLGAVVYLMARCWPALLGLIAGLVAWLKFAQPAGKKVIGCLLLVIAGLVARALVP